MTNKEILRADLLDILFENRNKSYGAYSLRKSYDQRVILSLIISLAVTFLIVFLFLNQQRQNGQSGFSKFSKDSVILTQVVLPPNLPPPPQPPPEPDTRPRSAEVEFLTITVAPDDSVHDVLPDQGRLELERISNRNVISDYYDNRAMPLTEDGRGDYQETSQTPVKEIRMEEQPASFPGGESAWLRFLQRYLRAPVDLEPGKRVEVRVRFRIETDGTISGFEIVQSGGSLFDREVLRVMKKMPIWNPAKQNNHLVSVAFTQPVIFLGVEE